jgi:hypothetical protein
MLLALAVLMVQPTPSVAGPVVVAQSLQAVAQAVPAHVEDEKTGSRNSGTAADKDGKTDKSGSDSTAKAPKTAEPVFPTPIKDDPDAAGATPKSTSPSEAGFTAPAKDPRATEKSAPVPVAQVKIPATLPVGAYLPGQLSLVATPKAAGPAGATVTNVNESSSRDMSGVAAAAPAAFKPTRYSPVRETGRFRGMPRKWLLLGAVEHGAATFDAYSTRQVITSGTGYEMNPMLRPFANSGALYGAVQVMPLAFDYLSLRMLHSQHSWMRKMWWLPQSASTAASLFGGVHNSMMH